MHAGNHLHNNPAPITHTSLMKDKNLILEDKNDNDESSSDDSNDFDEYKEYKAGFQEFVNTISKSIQTTPNIIGGNSKNKALMLFVNFKNEGKISKKIKRVNKTVGGKLHCIEKHIESSKKFDISEAIEIDESEQALYGEYRDITD